ncbi:MAG: hypothetical protein E8D44_00030 [Nitrospira sp.]|nr:MAG: hypothetical protein E8D44_00030 [Nitrospira sp.]
MPKKAQQSRPRNKKGGTTSRQTGTALTDLIRTVSEVGRVWPTADQILPSTMLEALPDTAKRKVLSVFEQEQKRAYKCLRWARWMSERRHLHVRCVDCHKTASSYSTVKQRDPKTGTYRVDEGKRRWECVSKAVENAAGKATDRSPQSLRPKGCGKKFCDTSGTPFANARVPIGLVLAALYYPDGTIERLLEAEGRQSQVLAIQKIVKELARRRHKELHSRLQRYARLFCGEMLLFRCSELTDPFGGRTLVQRNYAIEEIAIGFIQNNYKKIWTVLMLKYQAVRMALGQIKRLDRSLVHGAPLDRGYRRKLVNALQCAVRALTAPLTEF